MKKIFTLIAVVTIFTTASFAQRNFNNQNTSAYNNYNNSVAINTPRYQQNEYYANNNRLDFREREIARINREFDHQIWEINSKLFMPRFKKEMLIHQINEQRKFQIANVYHKINDRGFRDNDYGKH